MTAGASDRLPDPLVDALVRNGTLTPEAARAALDRQVMHGGALDTALLEVGLPEPAILAAMTEVYEPTMATPAELAGAQDPRALRAIPEQWALRHRLPPVRLTDGGRSLVVLSPAPADLQLIARLSELLDLTVVPHLALEVRVVQALSRLYGTRPPDRFLPLLVQSSRRASTNGSLEPLSFSEASSRLRSPETRHDIGRALLGYALRELAFGSLWVVKEDQLEGWMGFGAGSERIGSQAIRLAEGSAAQVVIESRAHHLGPSPSDATQDQLLAALGRERPRAVLMIPLRVRNRVVALFHGENGPDPIPGRLAGDIMLLVSQVQAAFEQLLLRRKAESLSQLSRAPAPAADDSTVEGAEPIEGDELEIEPPSIPEFEPDPALLEDVPPPEAPPTHPPDPTASLPDEPLSTVPGSDDDDWEPVEVADGNFVQGYELVPPRVLTAEDRIASGPSSPVAVAPMDSGGLPPVQPPEAPELGSDGLRLVPSELQPRALTDDAEDSDDLWHVGGASTLTGPRPSAEELAAPDPTSEGGGDDEEVEPTFPSVPRDAVPEGAAPGGAEVDPNGSVDEWVEIEAPDEAPPRDAPAPSPPPPLETPDDIEEALWAEAGRGLAESLLDEPPSEPAPSASRSEDDAPSSAEPPRRTETDEHWDPSESNTWSVPNLGPALEREGGRPRSTESPPASTSSQPVLLIDRADHGVLPDSIEAALPHQVVQSGAPEPAPPERSDDDAIVSDLDRLAEPDVEVRSAARRRLLERGPTILARAVERFPGPLAVDPFQRRTVPPFEACGPLLAVISRFGAEAHPYISRRLEAPDPRVRFYAAYFYSSAHVPEVIPRLIQRLHDEEPRICMMAARTLFGYRGHPDFTLVIEHLHGRLGATSVAARRHAAYLVGLFRDVSAIPILIDILERRDRNLVDVAEDALAEITKQQLGPQPRKWRAWLEKNRGRSRIGWLIDGLASRDEAIRRSAAEELRAVTGQDFGFEADAPKRRREDARHRWVDWWEQQPGARGAG